MKCRTFRSISGLYLLDATIISPVVTIKMSLDVAKCHLEAKLRPSPDRNRCPQRCPTFGSMLEWQWQSGSGWWEITGRWAWSKAPGSLGSVHVEREIQKFQSSLMIGLGATRGQGHCRDRGTDGWFYGCCIGNARPGQGILHRRDRQAPKQGCESRALTFHIYSDSILVKNVGKGRHCRWPKQYGVIPSTKVFKPEEVEVLNDMFKRHV